MEFFTINEMVTGLTIKLNNTYRFRILQVNAPTSTYSDEERKDFYEDVETAKKKYEAQFSMLIGDF